MFTKTLHQHLRSEKEAKNLLFQESGVSLSMRFNEFFDWILRIESAKPLMYIAAIDISKKKTSLGINEVKAEILTVIPKTRFR